MVGRTRYDLPLSETLARKFDALEAELEVRVLATARRMSAADPRFRLYRPLPLGPLEGAAFYALLPLRVARELRVFQPDAVLAQGGQEAALVLLGRALARSRAKVVLDIHGDWRAPTRLYGSPARRLLAPFGDFLARVAVRRADAVRTISAYTTGLVRREGVEPAAEFPAFMDLEPFTVSPPAPLPEQPTVLFVGVLERYKAVDVLARRTAADRGQRDDERDGRGAGGRAPSERHVVVGGADARDCSRTRCHDRARVAVPFRRARPSRRRGVLPRPRRRRLPRRRDPGSRHRR